MAQAVKNLPVMWEMQKTQFQSVDWEDPLEEEMAARSSILAWKMPWTEEPGEPQFIELQLKADVRVGKGEGNGTPLQFSCLENPMDGGAW